MARYRILKRPCSTKPDTPRYDVQVRTWWLGEWWTVDFFFTQEEAEEYLTRLPLKTIKKEVVKEVVL
jgi:hypothetical protein